eukprot:TRINITY_DN2413_c0_g6_i1.p1 TRINITY_DN2413_c0_g6~~TRINITY_DN2413_c0_g6_i1.p1  ORF type:complete len:1036 (-),score=258.10 TRINITY_DN2413_c0_g6_i1:196-3303(-)
MALMGANGGEEARSAAYRKIMQAVVLRDRIIERQNLVMSLASQVLREISTDKAVPRLVEVASKVLACERVSIFLVEGDELVCHAAPVGGETGWRLPMSKGIAGRVAASGMPMNIRDAYECPELFDCSSDKNTGYRTRSILCMPMKDTDGGVIGVLQAINKCGTQEPETESYAVFDDVDARMLDLLLTLLGEHLRVCSLADAKKAAEEKAREVRALIQGVCAQRDVAATVQKLAHAVLTVVTCQKALIFLKEEEGDGFICRACAGGPSCEGKRIALGPVMECGSNGEEQLLEAGVHEKEIAAFDLWMKADMTSRQASKSDEATAKPPPGRSKSWSLRLSPGADEDRVDSVLIAPMRDAPTGEIVGVVVAINKILSFADATATDSDTGKPTARRRSISISGCTAMASTSRTSLSAMALGQKLNLNHDNLLVGGICCFEKCDCAELESLLSLAAQMVRVTHLYSNQQRYSRKLAAVLSLLSDCRSGFQNKDLLSVVTHISQYSKIMFECDRCTFFIVNEITGELVGHFVLEDKDKNDVRLERLVVPRQGVVGRVVTTGEMLNISDAWNNPWFSNSQDLLTGYRTRTILCAPLKTSNGKVIAVLQCINKIHNEYFGADDDNMIRIVSTLISDLIHRTVLETSYKSLGSESNAVTDDMKDLFRAYYDDTESAVLEAPPKQESKKSTLRCELGTIGSDISNVVLDWGFDHLSLFQAADVWDYMPYINACFDHFALFQKYSVQRSRFEEFVRKISMRYSNTTAYHNWGHAFGTLHGTFLLVISQAFHGIISSEAVLGILLAALGHDVEHPGCTNAFQVATYSKLALRYNDASVLENHHASVTSSLLWANDGPSLLCESDSKTQRVVRQVLVSSILWTDMTKHQDILTWLQSSNLSVAGLRQNEEQLDAESTLKMCQALLHTADLIHPVTPWSMHQRVSLMIAREFYCQHQDELRLGLPTLPFMGKNPEAVRELAPIQTGFVQFVVAPLWSGVNFVAGEEKLKFALDNIDSNKASWQRIADGGEATEGQEPYKRPAAAAPRQP